VKVKPWTESVVVCGIMDGDDRRWSVTFFRDPPATGWSYDLVVGTLKARGRVNRWTKPCPTVATRLVREALGRAERVARVHRPRRAKAWQVIG